MPFRMMPVRPIVVAAAVLGLTACAGLAKPGKELWPYGYGAAEEPSEPTPPAATQDVAGESGPAVLTTRSLDGRNATYVGNRSTRQITVVYQLDGEPIQQVTLDPGSELPVGYKPGRIIAVR